MKDKSYEPEHIDNFPNSLRDIAQSLIRLADLIESGGEGSQDSQDTEETDQDVLRRLAKARRRRSNRRLRISDDWKG